MSRNVAAFSCCRSFKNKKINKVVRNPELKLKLFVNNVRLLTKKRLNYIFTAVETRISFDNNLDSERLLQMKSDLSKKIFSKPGDSTFFLLKGREIYSKTRSSQKFAKRINIPVKILRSASSL